MHSISVSVFLLQLPQGETKSAEACYGVYRECDYYSLECAEDEVIRLGTLKYGLKEQAVSDQLAGFVWQHNVS